MMLINSVIELIKSRGLEYNYHSSGATDMLWIYKDGKLLRTFIVNAEGVDARDFYNWMKYYNEKLCQSN